MIKNIKKVHIFYITALAVVCAVSFFWLNGDNEQHVNIIRSYEKDKDFTALVTIMKDNHYLISERQDFFPERTLTWLAPLDDPSKKGQATFLVATSDEKTCGFIAFYQSSRSLGNIWLLAVDKPCRGRGLGNLLMAQAIEQLKSKKVEEIEIAVRIINKPAVALYKKFGFMEHRRYDERGLVILRKKL